MLRAMVRKLKLPKKLIPQQEPGLHRKLLQLIQHQKNLRQKRQLSHQLPLHQLPVKLNRRALLLKNRQLLKKPSRSNLVNCPKIEFGVNPHGNIEVEPRI